MVFFYYEVSTSSQVWNPGYTAFPDFTHPKAVEFWSSQLKDLYSVLKFDGLWIVSISPYFVQVTLELGSNLGSYALRVPGLFS